MAVNLKLGDRLAIIRDGVKKGYTPQEAMQQYQINKDGGYNNWKNQFKQTTGINPDQDDTYNYEQFFKENPEAAKQLIQGKVSPEILQMYKTPQAIQREKQVQQQRQKGNINSLMDYAQYEKLINDYMNKSVNISSYGGPVSINIYAEGTDDLNEKEITEWGTKKHQWGTTSTPDYIDVTPEELESLTNSVLIDLPQSVRNDETITSQEYRNLPKTKFISIPYSFLKSRYPNLQGINDGESITYYLQDFDTEDEEGNPKQTYRIQKVKKYNDIGRALEYWKENQRKADYLNSDTFYKDDRYWDEPIDISGTIPLDNITVVAQKNNVPTETIELPLRNASSGEKVLNIAEQTLNGAGNSNYLLDNASKTGLTNGAFDGVPYGTASTIGNTPSRYVYWDKNIPYDDFQFTPYEWQQDPLYYLEPPGYVPVPNWNIQQIQDTEEGVDFADFMKMLAGYKDNSLRDQLMAKLFESKDYFADPYAGNHYTDTQSFYDAYDNNPYNRIQRESNGIPLYSIGGNIK